MNLLNKIYNLILFTFDIKWPLKLAVLLTAFIQPIIIPVGIIIFFLVTDMVTSIYSQYKVRKRKLGSKLKFAGFCPKILWRTIEPSLMLETVDKIIGYSIAMLISLIFDRYVYRITHLDFLNILSTTNAVFTLILTKETFSIFKKLGTITNNKIFNQLQALIVKKPKNLKPDEE